MENSLLVNFAEIWPKTLYYSTGSWPDFGATLKIHKNPILIGISSKFLGNISTCMCLRKCNKNGEFSPCKFCRNLAKDPVL